MGMVQDGHDLALSAWLIQVRGLANRNEGMEPGLTNSMSMEMMGWPIEMRGGRAAQGPSRKVRDWEGPGLPGHVDKSEGLGRARPAQGLAEANPSHGLRPCLVPPLGY